MPLTNAERQKRHRERQRAAGAAGGLTPEQTADRDAVMAEPIWPTPTGAARDQIPTFMGWNRYDWAAAPEALIDHFGMREACEGWRAEHQAMTATEQEIHARRSARAEAIVDQCGDVARNVMLNGGTNALFQAFEADPTLGQKRRKRVT